MQTTANIHIRAQVTEVPPSAAKQLGITQIGRLGISIPTYKTAKPLEVVAGKNKFEKWWQVRAGNRALRLHLFRAGVDEVDFFQRLEWKNVANRAAARKESAKPKCWHCGVVESKGRECQNCGVIQD